MVIRNVTPNIATFSVPFSRFGSVKIGGRGTLGTSLPSVGERKIERRVELYKVSREQRGKYEVERIQR